MMKKQIANWGNYPVIETDEKSFAFDQQLQELFNSEKQFIPRGNGRCYGDASLADVTISTLNTTMYFPLIPQMEFLNARVVLRLTRCLK